MNADGDVSGAWDANAEQWMAWARTPEHDVYFWQLNLPAFELLLPPPGGRTLDVGCGEGRLGRLLASSGHRMFGIDNSATLAGAARDAAGYEQVLCADAIAMPWPAAHFDLAIAFMSLHDMPNPAAAINEIARVLAPEGILCVAIIHPINRPAEHLDGYFNDQRFSEVITRNGLEMTFDGIDRPLETYTRALADSAFVIEQLREPQASEAAIAKHPALGPAHQRPYFLHLRCRLTPRAQRP
jgi:SAM-dependent methyltransferase